MSFKYGMALSRALTSSAEPSLILAFAAGTATILSFRGSMSSLLADYIVDIADWRLSKGVDSDGS